ncbi:23688_t:CDS:2 [Gigaspora rosea]|nr:23688_t:CDS:2 [Gigaspora rosea]
MSETEYYEESKELTCSPMKQVRLKEVLIQIAWELWQAATWSGQINYNLGPPRRNESQLIDIYEKPLFGKNSSFTWNQASWEHGTSKDLCPDMKIDPNEWPNL